MRKKIIIIVCLVVIVVTLALTLIFTNSKKTKVISFRKNYDVSSYVDEKDEFNVNFLINNKKSYFVDKKQINTCFLTNKENDEMIDLKIIDIINNSEKIKYQKDNFYSFTFRFLIDFKIDSNYEWNNKDAFIVIKYNDNKIYNLNIGMLSFNKICENERTDFTITNIKATTSVVKDNSYLAGILIGLRILNNKSLTINKVDLLNGGVSVGKEVIMLDKVPDTNEFKDIVGYDFKESVKGNGSINYEINDSKTYYFYIPLYYEEDLIINKFPIKFTYTINNEVKEDYLVNYVYYEVQQENISKDNIHIYEVK